MMSHGNFISATACVKYIEKFNLNADDVHLSYLPMAHIFEKFNMVGMLTNGG